MKKLLTGTVDESVHDQFVRFGKGTFGNRAMVQIKKSTKGLKIQTSFEYSTDLANIIAREATGPITLSGVVVTAHDISKELPFPAIYTKRMGVGKVEIAETTVSKEALQAFLAKVTDKLLLLNIAASNCTLATKDKIPNPKKSPKIDAEGKEEEPKIDHCKATFTNPKIAEEFLFETKEYTTVRVIHTYVIDGFEVPAQYKDKPEEARLNAKRKGKIIRKLDIDGTKSEKEYPFSA